MVSRWPQSAGIAFSTMTAGAKQAARAARLLVKKKGAVKTEGAGAFRPPQPDRNIERALAPGPKAPPILHPIFVGLKPRAPSMKPLAKFFYAIG